MSQIKVGENVEKLVDFIGEILAFLTVGLWVFMFFQYAFGFLDGINAGGWSLAGLLEYIKGWSTLLVLGLKGFEFALKRGFLIFIIYAVLVAACVIFMFVPEVLDNLFGRI